MSEAISVVRPRPTLTPTPSVIRVLASWQNSHYMDRVHLDAALTCQSCHVPFPPDHEPASDVCLACHEGSYYAMGRLTSNLDPNPHHGCREFPCTSCHGAHKPFFFFCSRCHDFRDSGRFDEPTATAVP